MKFIIIASLFASITVHAENMASSVEMTPSEQERETILLGPNSFKGLNKLRELKLQKFESDRYLEMPTKKMHSKDMFSINGAAALLAKRQTSEIGRGFNEKTLQAMFSGDVNQCLSPVSKQAHLSDTKIRIENCLKTLDLCPIADDMHDEAMFPRGTIVVFNRYWTDNVATVKIDHKKYYASGHTFDPRLLQLGDKKGLQFVGAYAACK